MDNKLQTKIDQSIRLLQSVAEGYDGVIEVAYSGGKDSDVILQLAKEAGINHEAIYKATTIDPPGTIRHAREMGATVIRPKKTFFQIIRERGFPSRRARFCCEILKEYKVKNKAIIGIRKSESVKRAKRYSEPTQCRWFGSKKPENHVEHIYPILDWTDADVLAFVQDRGLKLAPVYYDDNGNIDVSRRLGCLCCPLTSNKKRIEAFKKYPGMVKAYIRNGQKYLDSHPEGKIASRYDNAYEWFYGDLFLSRNGEWYELNHNLFEKANFEEFIKQYFKIK